MAQTKIYPSTQAQVQAVQNTVDEINSKIVAPTYQVKTVTPSNVQQTVQADNGYTALWSVTVEPIAAAMPENLEAFIMDSSVEPFSISIDGVVPAYACYHKTYLKRVYGNPTSIGSYAFHNCSTLENVEFSNVVSIGTSAFENCGVLENLYAPNLTSLNNSAFKNCSSLKKVYAPKLASFGNATIQTFGNCTSLKSVDLRGLTIFGTNGGATFAGCTSLQYVDLRGLTKFGTNTGTFSSCTSLSLIDFTLASSVITLNNTNNFSGTSNDWIAVVADDTMKAAYQSATNWSTYASHIKTIAEVEAEVGMTYDEYYLQCFGHPRFD